jgi:hypothetical protein
LASFSRLGLFKFCKNMAKVIDLFSHVCYVQT